MHYKVVHTGPRVIWATPVSLTLSCLSPQLTLMQIQKPFFLLFKQMKSVLASGLAFTFFFLIFTWLTPFHHAGLRSNSISPRGLPSSYPILVLLTYPSYFFYSSYHHQKLSLKFTPHPQFPNIRSGRTGFLSVLFLHPAEGAGASLALSGFFLRNEKIIH